MADHKEYRHITLGDVSEAARNKLVDAASRVGLQLWCGFDVELSDDAKFALRLTDVFHDAAITDCYVTRALVAAIELGIGFLSTEDFEGLIAEIDDDIVHERFIQARKVAEERFGPAPGTRIFPLLEEGANGDV